MTVRLTLCERRGCTTVEQSFTVFSEEAAHVASDEFVAGGDNRYALIVPL